MTLATTLIADKLQHCAKDIDDIRKHEDRINAFGAWLESLSGHCDRFGNFIESVVLYTTGKQPTLRLQMCVTFAEASHRTVISILESTLGQSLDFIEKESNHHEAVYVHDSLGPIYIMVTGIGADMVFADAMQDAA